MTDPKPQNLPPEAPSEHNGISQSLPSAAPSDRDSISQSPTSAAPSGSHDKKQDAPRGSLDEPVSSWFFTFMCMNIPVIGWFYLIWLAFNKKKVRRRNFARAYLFYKLIFLGISAILLGILIWVGLDLLDQLLAYMQML